MPSYYEDLSIKTFKAETIEEIDKLCNDFRKRNVIKATQANPTYDFHQKKIFYIYTLFYYEKKDKVSEPVGSGAENKVEEKVANLPKMIISDSEAKWATCSECNSRWKWTHYRLCPKKHGIEALPEEHHELYKKIWNGDGNGNSKIDTAHTKAESVL